MIVSVCLIDSEFHDEKWHYTDRVKRTTSLALDVQVAMTTHCVTAGMDG